MRLGFAGTRSPARRPRARRAVQTRGQVLRQWQAMHAATLEIDAVIDPADTRLAGAWPGLGRVGALGPRFVDTW